MGMKQTWQTLLSSRKFWVGTITVAAVLGAVFLRSTGKIPADALIPTVTSLTAVAMSVIGSIAWEDAATSASTGSAETPPPPDAPREAAPPETPPRPGIAGDPPPLDPPDPPAPPAALVLTQT